MNRLHKENEKNNIGKPKINISNTYLIILYDFIILVAVGIVFFVFCGKSEHSEFTDMLLLSLAYCGIIFLYRYLFKIYNQVWRYGDIRSYIRLLMSDGFAYLTFFLLQLLHLIPWTSFSRSVSNACVALLCTLAIRLFYAYAYKCCKKHTPLGNMLNRIVKIVSFGRVELNDDVNYSRISVAIVGAGQVGVMLAQELLAGKYSSLEPKFFVDTDKEKIGRQIIGLPVFDEKSVSQNLVDKYSIREFILALPQISVEKKKELYELYKKYGCKVRIYDYPIIESASVKRRLRDFDIDDLMPRAEIDFSNENAIKCYSGKVVLVTGGGGSIGSELCRQLAIARPKQIVILDIYENGAYDLQQELIAAYKGKIDIKIEILSVCNRAALERVFESYHPNVVINAAAHKHVPLMEHNCLEAIENNIFGTLNTVELSEKYNVERYVMVSTDKAVNPTNVMGATKRMCEMIVLCHSKMSPSTKFSATRFGNVLGSAGSVVPLFKKQIANGGPVTVTDKRIVRYFMTIPEASRLVLQSGAMAENGELFVLDMGKPVKILTLAENMISLCGYEPYKDIDIVETGLRPGEKLYEELLIKSESTYKTENELIFIEHDNPISRDELTFKLNILRDALNSGDEKIAKEALKKVVPTYKDPDEVNLNVKLPE